MSGKRSRRRHRQGEGRRSGVRVSTDSDGTARVSVADLSEREQLEFLEVLVNEAANTGTKVIVGGEEVTPDDVEAIKADDCRPADPPDASLGWLEDVAGHDQAAAALLDWLTNLDGDYSAPEDDHAWQTLTTISAAMPEHATVSVVVELSEGHLIATLINRNQAPAITVLYYGADDPERWGDPRDAQVISLTRDEG